MEFTGACMYEQDEKHSSTALFSSLKLSILIIYFHQAVGKVYIIDGIMLCRV